MSLCGGIKSILQYSDMNYRSFNPSEEQKTVRIEPKDLILDFLLFVKKGGNLLLHLEFFIDYDPVNFTFSISNLNQLKLP